MRDLLTADPTRSAPTPAKDESGTTSATTGAEADPPHQRQTERRSAPRSTGTTPRDSPPTFSALTAPAGATQGRHTTPRVLLYSAKRARHHARSTTPAAAYISAPPTSYHHKGLAFRKCAKNEMTTPPALCPIFSIFHALDGGRNGSTADGQISLMRRINRRSTEPRRSGATFTFALNPGRAVALLGRPKINSFWNYPPRTPLPQKHVNPT